MTTIGQEICYGAVTDVTDHGTIVTVTLEHGPPIHMDHSPFRWFAESYGYDLRGIEFESDGYTIWEMEA